MSSTHLVNAPFFNGYCQGVNNMALNLSAFEERNKETPYTGSLNLSAFGIKKKEKPIPWDSLSLGTIASKVEPTPLGLANTTPQTVSKEKVGEILSVPDITSGLITSVPARLTALAFGLKQPSVETFSQQTESIFPEKLGTPGKTLGVLAAMIGDPLNLIDAGAGELSRLSKVLAKTDDIVETTRLLREFGFSDEYIAKIGGSIQKEVSSSKIYSVLRSDLDAFAKGKSVLNPLIENGKKTIGSNVAVEYKALSESATKAISEGRTAGNFVQQQLPSLVEKSSPNAIYRNVSVDAANVGKSIKDIAPVLSGEKAPQIEQIILRPGANVVATETPEIKTLIQDALAQNKKLPDLAAQRGIDAMRAPNGEVTILNKGAVLARKDAAPLFARAKGTIEDVYAAASKAPKKEPTSFQQGRFIGKQSGFAQGREIGLKQGLKEGEAAGKQIGKAGAENIAETKTAKAVRKEQLKSLKGGITLRAKYDKILDVLRNKAQSAERVKALITDYAKDALSPKNRGKAMTLIRDAKTQRDLTKAFARIQRYADEEIKLALKNSILKLQKKILSSPSVAVDYKERVKELMGGFEFKGHREGLIERLKATQEFFEKEAAAGKDVEIPRRVVEALSLLQRKPLEEITVSQMKGVQAQLELLEQIGRTKFRTTAAIWEAQKGAIVDAVKSQNAPKLTEHEKIRPKVGERLTGTQKFKNLLFSSMNKAADVDRALSPMDVIFDLLDGSHGTYDGANYRFFKGTVDSSFGKYVQRYAELLDPVTELISKHGLKDTEMERIGVVAAREQDGGMEKLLASGFTEKEVNDVVLTEQEMEVLNKMRELMDGQFASVKDVMRRVYNQDVKKVKNYFSFMTDWKAMDGREVWEQMGSGALEYGRPKKNVERGFTLARVGGKQRIKVNAFDVFSKHMDNVSYLIEMGETSKMLGEVANSEAYREAVGDVGALMVSEWVDVVARKGGAAGAQQIALLDALRKNVGTGVLALKLSSIAIQPTSIIDGMGFIGVEAGSRGVGHIMGSSDWRNFVFSMPEIKDRLGGEFALRELTGDSWYGKIQQKGFVPLQELDRFAAASVAAGAYERKMIELGQAIDFTKMNEEALAYAQLAVRRTQSSGSFKDVPLAISRGALTGNRSLDRAILQFQNFLLTRWSRIRHDAIRVGITEKDPKKAIPVFTAVLMSGLAATGIRAGLNEVTDLVTGRERNGNLEERLARSLFFELSGNIPFLGNILGMALYDSEMFPILDAPKGVLVGGNNVVNGKTLQTKMRGLTELSGSIGEVFGVPGSAQAQQTAGDFLSGKGKKNQGISIPDINIPNVNIPEINIPNINL